jgi:phosphatidylinositol glycan class K
MQRSTTIIGLYSSVARAPLSLCCLSVRQVSTSRYWFNYRHTANTLSLYHTIKSLGIPDSQILLMLPDEYACNARNTLPAAMYNTASTPGGERMNLYARDIEVDYRGEEVSVESFLRLLTGRHSDSTPRSHRLETDENSNILIYMSGHGGDNFLKFQDREEMNAEDVAGAFAQMHIQRRYRSIMLMVDTCQAGTLFNALNKEETPNIVTIGSSGLGENSYSVSA